MPKFVQVVKGEDHAVLALDSDGNVWVYDVTYLGKNEVGVHVHRRRWVKLENES